MDNYLKISEAHIHITILILNKLVSKNFLFQSAPKEFKQADLILAVEVKDIDHKKLLKIIFMSMKNKLVKLQLDGVV